MARTQTLTDHDAIREWATAHHATPALQRATARAGSSPGLALDAHDIGAEPLDDVMWDKWFERFDRWGLALLVSHNTREVSNSYQLVPRSHNRVHTGAARRRHHPVGGNQPIGARARSAGNASAPASRPPALSNPASYEPEGSRRVDDARPGKNAKRQRHHKATKQVWARRRSESRRKSDARRPAASPRKSSSKSGRTKARRY
jgi:hypothetical protein